MKKITHILLILFVLLTGCSKTTQAPVNQEPIRIGVDVFPGWAHVFIARDKGFFEKNGVKVEIVFKKDYLAVQEDFANGVSDGVFTVYADAIFTNEQTVPLKVVYISDQSVKGDVIVAGTAINSLEECKGKKIGVEGINSFSHLFVLSVLKKHGINEGDVHFENVGAQELVEALEKGKVDAGHTYGPGKTQAQQKGYHFLAYAGDVQGIITDVLVFNPKIIQERPEDIKKIIKSLFEAKEFQGTHRIEALQILANAIGDSSESVAEGIDAVKYFDIKENSDAMRPQDDLTNLFGAGKVIVDFYMNRGQIVSMLDLREIIDNSFVEQLLTDAR